MWVLKQLYEIGLVVIGIIVVAVVLGTCFKSSNSGSDTPKPYVKGAADHEDGTYIDPKIPGATVTYKDGKLVRRCYARLPDPLPQYSSRGEDEPDCIEYIY